MMLLLTSVGYWLGVLLLGLTVLTLLDSRLCLRSLSVLPAAFGLGTGSLSMLLFWCSLAGFVPSRPLVLGVFGFSLVALSVLWRSRRLSRLRRQPVPDEATVAGGTPGAIAARSTTTTLPINVLLIIALVIPCGWVALDTLTTPLSNIDAVAIWGLKAKVVVHEPVRESGYFQDVSKSFSHLDYPLLWPFVTAGQYALAGRTDELLTKSVSLSFFVMFVLMTFEAVRASLPVRQSLLLLLLYVSIPALLSQSAAGIADIGVMFYYVGSVRYLIQWTKTGRRADLLIGALFCSFLAFVKNEGMALAPMNVLVVGFWAIAGARWSHASGAGTVGSGTSRGFGDAHNAAGAPNRDKGVAAKNVHRFAASKRSLRDAASYAVVVVGLNIPWFIFSAGIPRTHENYLGRLRVSILADNLDRVPMVAESFTRAILDVGYWHALWILLIVAVPTGHGGADRPRAGLLWLLLLMHLATYFLILLVTPWDIAVLLRIKTYPLLLQASPVVVLLVAEYWHGCIRSYCQRFAADGDGSG